MRMLLEWTRSAATILFAMVCLSVMTSSTALTTSAEATVETAGEPTSISVFGDANLSVPPEFKRVEVQSRILEHEFQAKAGEGGEGQTARVTMMAAGGDVAENIKRWKGQFAGGDPESQKTEEIKVGDWQVHIVDVSGTYQESMGGPFAGGKVVTRENYAMAGGILVHPKGQKYFVKMIGPNEVVKANRQAFVEMLKSIK